jgi:MFS family permease
METPVTERVSRWGWTLLALLTALNILHFVDRQLIASLAPMLMEDLGLTRAQIGLLVGFAFVVFYTLMGLVLGTVADRISRPRLIAAGLCLWSAMTAASGFARSFAHLAVPRMLVGAGEATLTPAALSMLADVLPARRLALATGVYYTGIPLGTALSLFVAGWLAPHYGWRACFFLLGLVGLAFAVALLWIPDPRGPTRAAPGRAAATGSSILGTLAHTVRQVPAYGLTILGGALLTYASAAALHAMTWLVQERQFSFAAAAYTSGTVAVAAGLFGNVAGGWFGDTCTRWSPAGRLWALVAMTVALTPCAVAFFTMDPGTPAFYVAWFFTSCSATAYFGPLFAVIQSLSPVRIRSTAVAFALLGMNLLGVGPGPWITGMIGDASSLTRGLLVSVFVALGSVVPLSLAALRYETDLDRAQRL